MHVECLERRSLLAGNITVAVTDGTLFVRGDDAANGVIIQMAKPEGTVDPSNPPPLKLEVLGVRAGDAATTVNGGTTKFVAEGVTKGVVVELGKGNDALTIANPPPPQPAEGQPPPPPPPAVLLPGTVQINAGEGNDRVNGSIANRAGLNVVLGPGNDGLHLWGSPLNNVQIFGDVPPPPPNTAAAAADSGDTDPPPPPPPGSDQVVLTGVHAAGTTLIDTAVGDDAVKVEGRSAFDKGLRINTGDGNDGVQILGLPAKDDKPAVPVLIQGGLQITLGGGNDRANLAIVNVAGTASIDAGAGNDGVNLGGVKARDGLFAALGAGDDKLTVGWSASKSAKFSGGDGTDLFTDKGNNHFDSLTKEGFEDPPAT